MLCVLVVPIRATNESFRTLAASWSHALTSELRQRSMYTLLAIVCELHAGRSKCIMGSGDHVGQMFAVFTLAGVVGDRKTVCRGRASFPGGVVQAGWDSAGTLRVSLLMHVSVWRARVG
jgi:hypothetical protein